MELKAIDPPPSIKDSMEKKMRADREKRVVILNAEGARESAKNRRRPKASRDPGRRRPGTGSHSRRGGDRQWYLQAQGQAKAVEKVFAAVKHGKPTPELLAYQ